jgi:CHAT domain-containing protein/TPR repeat protein
VVTLSSVDDLAEIQNFAIAIVNFNNLLGEFPIDNKAINLEIAIMSDEVVAYFFTHKTFPKLGGTIQNNLGHFYTLRFLGDRANNLEKAINCCNQALLVTSPENFPAEWAQTQNNLGNAYAERILGDKADNLEQAINCFEQALLVTCDSFPVEWAKNQNNLGTVYHERIFGDEADNLEKAINHFNQALLIYNPDAFPEYWADVQNNLGNIYVDRIFGDRADNLEKAINYYKQALLVRTREAFPNEWAQTQNNFGNAYLDRIVGDNANNLEEAINHYNQALLVRTRENYPVEWAQSQNNLGNAYLDRLVGDRADNLEQAISCYEKVLLEYVRDTLPEQWAMSQNNLGIAYNNLSDIQKDKHIKAKFYALAIEHYTKALQVYTPLFFPSKYAETQFNLGFVYQKNHQLQLAYNTFTEVIKTIKFLRGEIVSRDEAKQKLAEKWNQLYWCMVEVCLDLDHSKEAIEHIEHSKARNLVELLATNQLYPKCGLYSDSNNYLNICHRLDYLRREISSKQRQLEIFATTIKSEEKNRTHIEQLQQQLNDLQQQLASVLKEIDQVDSSFQLTQQVKPFHFGEFQTSLDDKAAIIEWYITDDKFLAFIFTRYSYLPINWQSSFTDFKLLLKRTNVYRHLYYRPESGWWHTQLVSRLQNFAEILHMDELISHVPDECNQLILIPHRFLHLFPLHALPLADGKSLLDKFDSIRYIPSCQLLQQVRQQQRPNFSDFFAIQNPEDNLSYADLEVEVIRSFFSTDKVLEKQAATKVALIDNQDLSSIHCSHFSCHGTFNPESPLESALLLANEEHLTLADIFGLTLNQCRLVTLSACETGLTDPTSISDEYIGLPSGFLYAGSTNVVSSLWTVNQVSTTFLMIKFYQNLIKNQNSVAKALNDAQRWLRDATQQELVEWASKLNLDEDKIKQIKDELDWYDTDEKPFNSPYHWAGFCAIGQ